MEYSVVLLILVLGFTCYQAEAQRGRRCPPPPRIKNGQLKMTYRGMRIEYSCNNGFELAGTNYVSCNLWGRWNRFPPVCVARGCYRMSAPTYGDVELSHGGAVASFGCTEGYLLKGAKVVTCDGRNWNGTVPYCMVDKYYKPVNNDNHNTIDYDKPVNYPHNPAWERRSHEAWLEEADYSCVGQGKYVVAPEVAHASPFTKFAFVRGQAKLFTIYRCKFGYELHGEKSYLYCVKGEWLGNRQKCVKKESRRYSSYGYYQGDAPRSPSSHDEWIKYADYTCFYPDKGVSAPEIDNAIKIAQSATSEGLPHLFVEYSCEDGYVLSGSSKYMYCREERWLGEKPVCVRGYGSKDTRKSNSKEDKEVYPRPDKSSSSGCAVNNGGCEHQCTERWGRVRCTCNKGWKLDTDKKKCIDVDECAKRNGGCDHYCVNSEGSYSCECRRGYALASNNHKCRRSRG